MSSDINPSNNEVVETVHDPHQTQGTTHIREQIAGIEKETVNLNLGSSSHTDELKELGSDPVWEHFERQREEGTEYAVCNYCRKKLVGLINIGTEHLPNHFKNCSEKGKIDKIIQLYKEKKERLGTYLKDLSCRLCLSIHEYGKYILFWIHFIDGDWDMKEEIISIRKIEGNSNILRCLKDVLLEWRIDKNISSIIDSRKCEKDVVEYVMRFDEMKSWFTGRGSLPFAGKLLYTDSINNLTREYGKLLGNLEAHVLGKILKIFEYVQNGSSKDQNFQIAIERAKSLGKEVTAQVIGEEAYYDTKEYLDIAIGYKEAFFELENMDTEFRSINLTNEEWDQALAFNNSLEELFDDFSGNFWGDDAYMGFVLLCKLYTGSLLFSKFHLIFGDSEEICNHFVNIMDEQWSKNNLVVAVAAVLDPRFKLDIVQHWYKKIYGSEWGTQLTLFKDYFTDVYSEYARLDFLGRQQPYDSPISHKMLDPSGWPCKSSYNLEVVSLRKSELDLYLKEVKFPSIEKFDVLKWWHANKQYFPTLATMARDFLAINLKVDIPQSHTAYQYIFANEIKYPHSDIVKEASLYYCWKVVE